MHSIRWPRLLPLALACSLLPLGAQAAEGFMVRYNVAGSLGGEMFAAPDRSGLAAGVAVTYIDIDKITGSDGKLLTMGTPGGTVALPGAPAQIHPTYNANRLLVHGGGTQTQFNLAVGYITPDTYAGGRFLYGLNLPFAKKRQKFAGEGATPALNWPHPAMPDAATRSAVTQQFSRTYQGMVAAQGAAETGHVTGVGDLELSGGWMHATAQTRTLLGVSLVTPTGKYNAAAGPDIGYGNFYTLRPSAQFVYLPRPDIALAGKFTLGLNTRNKDNNLRSGHWAGFEAAAGYMTKLGPIGLHMVHVNQFKDDTGNSFGSSRLRSTNWGVFWTTKIPVLDTFLTLQHMQTTSSRNSRHGSFTQIRLSKQF